MRYRLACLLVACAALPACGGSDKSDGARGSDQTPAAVETPGLPDACEPETSPAGGLLVDDFEDDDELLDRAANLHGSWYVENDATGEPPPPAGVERPAGPLLASPGAPGSPEHALHTSGGGFREWGAFVAVKLNASRFSPCTYDVSSYRGVKLSVKGSGSLRFNLGTVSTTPVDDYGECTTDTCSDYGRVLELDRDWQDVEVPFSGLTQPDWATPGALDLTRALRLSFWAEKEGFDFWLDDVRFYE